MKINNQFWNKEKGWFYDTDISGKIFIEVQGPEGWIPLWATIADSVQASKVVMQMMDSSKFFTKIPFPTVSASHPKFKPYRGYWRGPVWIDQAYFAVKAMQNYGYHTEASVAIDKLVYNAKGLADKGPSIRENYHPLTGEGFESHNFSWSAVHYILMLIDE